MYSLVALPINATYECMYYISLHPCLTAVGKFINIYPDSDFEGLLVVGELLSVLQKFPV